MARLHTEIDFQNSLMDELIAIGFKAYKDKHSKYDSKEYATFNTQDNRTVEEKENCLGGKFDILIFEKESYRDISKNIFPMAIELKKPNASISDITDGILNQIGIQYKQTNLYWTCDNENWIKQKPKTLVFSTGNAISNSRIYESDDHAINEGSNYFIDRFCWRSGINTLYKYKNMFILFIRFKPSGNTIRGTPYTNNVYMMNLKTGDFLMHYDTERKKCYSLEEAYERLKVYV